MIYLLFGSRFFFLCFASCLGRYIIVSRLEVDMLIYVVIVRIRNRSSQVHCYLPIEEA